MSHQLTVLKCQLQCQHLFAWNLHIIILGVDVDYSVNVL